MSEPFNAEVVNDRSSLWFFPSISTLHQESILYYAETLSFLSFLFMVFFLPLFETWKNVGFGLALFFWLAQMSIARDFRIKLYPAGWGHLVFLGAVCLSAFFAINKFQGLRGVWDVFRYFAVYLIIINTFKTEKQIRSCIAVLLISVTIACLWGFTEYYLGIKEFLEINSLGHKNHTATYLAIVLALCGGLLVTNSRLGIYQFLLAGVMVVLGWALLLTQARSAWIALAIVYTTFLFLMKLRRARVILGVFIFFLLLLSLSIQPVRARLETLIHSPLKNEALLMRVQAWRNSFRLVNDHPLLGVGPRNFNFIDHEKYNLVGLDHAHSLYVNGLAELGVLGLSALLGWLASCWVTLKKIRKHSLSSDQYGYWLAALGALLIIMVSGIVTTTLHTEGAIAFSIVLGISVAAATQRCLRDSPEFSHGDGFLN